MSYLDNLKNNVKTNVMIEGDHKLPRDTYIIYVDGSFDTQNKNSGWGFVAIVNDQMVFMNNGNVNDAEIGSRNITGECYSAIKAVQWLESIGAEKAVIVHDYKGLGEWGTNNWKAKTPIAKKYKEVFQSNPTTIEFRWVRGHSNNEWNDFADVLAELGKQKETEEI